MKNCLENVRLISPLIHNITNYVTVNDVANVILACGGSPIMSDDIDEVDEIVSICGGLNLNIGTPDRCTLPTMLKAGKRAGEIGLPILLDPVGAGASRLRTSIAHELMGQLSLSVIRGNASEIRALACGDGTTKGVDASDADIVTEDALADYTRFLKDFSAKCGCIIAVTGKTDFIADSSTCYVVRNGRAEMESVTGTGCQLSGIMTAFLAANRNDKLKAAAAAVCTMGLAGEIAMEYMLPGDGNCAYRGRIIDAIYNMTGEALERGARYEIF